MKNKILILFFLPLIISAQINYDLHQFKEDTFNCITSPLKWKTNDWLTIAAVGSAVVLTMQVDEQLRNEIQNGKSQNRKAFIAAAKTYGEIYTPAILVGGLALHGWMSDNRVSKKMAFEITEAVLFAGGITTGLKIAFGRSRPYMNYGNQKFRPFTFLDNDYFSLPSGHTTMAFSVSTVLANNTDNTWLKILAYSPAFLTAYSRMYDDQHWASDVLLGGAIGYFVGNWVVNQHSENTSVMITPNSISLLLKF